MKTLSITPTTSFDERQASYTCGHKMIIAAALNAV
jgi:hypothetical protein